MAETNDLHGNAPDNSEVAVLLIDVINDFEFEGGEQLLESALLASRNIARLKMAAQEVNVPVIYVNDNFGKWRSDFKKLVSHCLEENVRGRQIAQLLKPDEDDYFVLKPKHSGFFSTTLDLLLEYLGVRRLVIVGFAGNNCVLFTASDAYMRDYQLYIPSDCTASLEKTENENALHQMRDLLKADIRASTEVNFHALQKKDSAEKGLASNGGTR